MLTDSYILNYVKRKLRVPFQKLEVSDEDLLEIIKLEVLETYSDYEPLKKYSYLNIHDANNIVDNQQNLFRIPLDEEDDDIRDVIEVLYTNNFIMYGHPVIGTINYESLPNWYLRAFKSRTTMITGMTQHTWEFIHPNLLRIYNHKQNCVVIYTVNHKKFETIPNRRHSLIRDMALASAMMYIGDIRKRFQSINTPFGDIQLNGDDLYSRGQELWDKCETKLKLIPPDRLFTDIQ